MNFVIYQPFFMDFLNFYGENMQLITAIIKPQKLDDVREALEKIEISGVTTTEVKGFGKQGGHTEMYRGSEYKVHFLEKIKLEIATQKDRVDDVVKAIMVSAKIGDGEFGDGKIFITTLDEVMRIRTGETGVVAL